MNLLIKARPFILYFVAALGSLFFSNQSMADVTLTSSATAAGNINQGSTDNIIYAVKMDVTVSAVTVNNIQFTLTGTHDNNDLTTLRVYFNATAPTISGATLMAVNIAATFAAPHAYSSTFNSAGSQTIAAGASGYFIITASVDPAATNGNTVIVNGAANPVVFGYTTVPTVVNNQSNIAGTQTILAAGVTLATSAIAAANIAQGTNDNIVYAVKMDVASLAVAVNNIQLTLTGTHDNNDLTILKVYFNAAAPAVSGASLVAVNITATFAAPHTYSSTFNVVGQQTIAAGTSGYFIITANVDPAATNGNTVKVDGAVNPVVFGYTTSPVITNNQTNIAGAQTILAAGVTLTTSAVAAANIAQGTNDNIVYAVKMDVVSLPVVVNNIQFTLSGTHDNNDLTTLRVYYNAAAPTVSGATLMAVNIAATFAAPHAYSSTFNSAGSQTIAAGASGYFIITASVDPAATNGNTVILNGATNPVIFGYTTSPVVTNNQTNIAGTQTILAAGVTLTTSAVSAANIAQGSNDNIVYAVKVDVTVLPVTINNIQFTLTGTFDNNDLTTLRVYFNAAAPTVSGATLLAVNIPATFASPHTFSSTFNSSGPQTISSGGSGYFIITANVDPAATNGNTLKLDGAANPVVFSYTTAPTITNNQSDLAGLQTILASGVTLSTPTIAPGSIPQGSVNNILYAVKMDVTSLPVTVNNIQFTLTGTFDNNDLTTLRVYFNSTPTLTGANLLAVNIPATFTAPHTFSNTFNSSGPLPIASGASGYFIITTGVDAAATVGNTVILNGATNPVVFSFTTAPPVTNNQTNVAGPQSIAGILPLTLINFSGNVINAQQTQLQWTTSGELNAGNFEVEWSADGILFNTIATQPAAVNSLQNKQYNYIHKTAVDGNNFYRLKMNDLDGRFTYSPVIKIRVAVTETKITVMQNPVNDLLQIQIQAEKNESLVFNLYSAEGKIIASKSLAVTKGNNRLSWNILSLAAGNYLIASPNHLFETIKISVIK
jgi:hypothetical protein